MTRSLKVTNEFGESMEMILEKPSLSGLAVTRIDGLGPPKGIINTSGSATYDGVAFNSSRMSERNIVLSVVYLGSPSIEDTRHLTYKHFPVKKKVRLRVETEKRVGEIDGWVESNEPDIFSAQSGATISILCPNPYFVDASEGGDRSARFYGIQPLFEFPFENPSHTVKYLEMGEHINLSSTTIDYQGDVDTGVVITATMYGPVKGLTFSNPLTGGHMVIGHSALSAILSSGFQSGDQLEIDTRRGRRAAHVVRGSTRYNIVNALGKNTAWLTLARGINEITVDSLPDHDIPGGVAHVRADILYQQLYEGV